MYFASREIPLPSVALEITSILGSDGKTLKLRKPEPAPAPAMAEPVQKPQKEALREEPKEEPKEETTQEHFARYTRKIPWLE